MAESAKMRRRQKLDENGLSSAPNKKVTQQKQRGRPPKLAETANVNGRNVPDDVKKNNDGKRENSPMFHDANLPKGWVRKLVQRSGGKTAGKYDVYIFSPEGQKFRSRTELAAYLTKSRSRLQIEDFDFTVTGKSNENHKTPDNDKNEGKEVEESLSRRREPRRVPRRSETFEEPELRSRRVVKRKRSSSTNGPVKIIEDVTEEDNLNAAKLVVKMDFGLRKFSVPDDLTAALEPAQRRRRPSVKLQSPTKPGPPPEHLLPRKRGRPRKLADILQRDLKKLKKRGRPKKGQEKNKPRRKAVTARNNHALDDTNSAHDQKDEDFEFSAPENEFDENGESAARVRPTEEFMLRGKRPRFLHEMPDLPPLEEPVPTTQYVNRPKVEHIPYTWTSTIPQRGSGEYLVLDSGHTYAKMARVTRDVLAMTHSRSKEIIVDERKPESESTKEEIVLPHDSARTISETVSVQSLLKLSNSGPPPQNSDKRPVFYLDSKHGLPLLRGLGGITNRRLVIKSPQATDINTMPMMSGDALE